MSEAIEKLFGNRVRARVCGLCWQNDRLLMIKHKNLHGGRSFWAPPGGGIDFGFSAQKALEAEFMEETGLLISVTKFQFVYEFIKEPLHGIEVFFEVAQKGGTLKKGYDPEMENEEQIIDDVRFMTLSEINSLQPEERHGMFDLLKTENQVKNAAGFLNNKS